MNNKITKNESYIFNIIICSVALYPTIESLPITNINFVMSVIYSLIFIAFLIYFRFKILLISFSPVLFLSIIPLIISIFVPFLIEQYIDKAYLSFLLLLFFIIPLYNYIIKSYLNKNFFINNQFRYILLFISLISILICNANKGYYGYVTGGGGNINNVLATIIPTFYIATSPFNKGLNINTRLFFLFITSIFSLIIYTIDAKYSFLSLLIYTIFTLFTIIPRLKGYVISRNLIFWGIVFTFFLQIIFYISSLISTTDGEFVLFDLDILFSLPYYNSISYRLLVFSYFFKDLSLRSLSHTFVLGHGFGSLARELTLYVPQLGDKVAEESWAPHNLLIQFIHDFGLLLPYFTIKSLLKPLRINLSIIYIFKKILQPLILQKLFFILLALLPLLACANPYQPFSSIWIFILLIYDTFATKKIA